MITIAPVKPVESRLGGRQTQKKDFKDRGCIIPRTSQQKSQYREKIRAAVAFKIVVLSTVSRNVQDPYGWWASGTLVYHLFEPMLAGSGFGAQHKGVQTKKAARCFGRDR